MASFGRSRERRERRRRDKRQRENLRLSPPGFGVWNDVTFFDSYPGDCSVWVICDRCRRPFEIPTGFHFSTMTPPGQEMPEFGEMRGGPCPHCWSDDGVEVSGPVPTVEIASPNGLGRAVAGNYSNAYRAFMEIATLLTEEKITEHEAAERLREEGGPLVRFAERIESHPVGASIAGSLLATIIAIIGPQFFGDEPPAIAPTQQPAVDPDIVGEIVDEVLDHYERHQEVPTPRERREIRGPRE